MWRRLFSCPNKKRMIKDYVLKEHGLKVPNLYISQVKRKCGIEVGENYNLPKSEDSRQPQCLEEKEYRHPAKVGCIHTLERSKKFNWNIMIKI